MWKALVVGTTMLTIAGSTLASAQQPAPAERSQRAQLTADDIAAFTDARIAAIKAALKLTPAQEKNWPAVEQTLRDISKERIARREARGAAGQRTDPTERLRGRADALTIRAANLRRLADAEKPLYQSLDEAQKRRFGMAFRFAAARRHMAEARTHGAGRPNKLAERSLATSPRDSHGAGWSPPRRLDRHGLRASQLCSLRLEQVDLVHARLHVSVPKITFCNNGTGSAKSPQSIPEFLSILNAMDSDFHLAVRPHLNATPTLSFQSNGRGCVQRSMTNVT